MITIIHGDDQVNSRKELERIIHAFDGEVVRFDRTFDPTDLYQRINGSLFGKTLIVLENYLSGKRKIDFDVSGADVVLWEPKEVSKTLIGKNKALEFKIPVTIWRFVDSLKPTNGKYLVPQFRATLKNSDPEFVFAMLVRQFRLMLNPDNLPPWQAGKIKAQAKVFGDNHLRQIYQKLLEIDYEIKSGRSPYNLTQQVERLLLWL